MIITFYLANTFIYFDGYFFYFDRYRSYILFKFDRGEILFCIVSDIVRQFLINVDLVKS
jgi:hypothetical protein